MKHPEDWLKEHLSFNSYAIDDMDDDGQLHDFVSANNISKYMELYAKYVATQSAQPASGYVGYSESDLKYHCTRFAHLARMKGCITNDDTVNLYEKEYAQSLKPQLTDEDKAL